MTISVVNTQILGLTITDVVHTSGTGLILGADLFQQTGLLPYSQIQIQNLETGNHWLTFIAPDTNLGHITLKGADARLAEPGDHIVILVFEQIEQVSSNYCPKTILF